MFTDVEIESIVETLTTYSCPIKPGDYVIIESIEAPAEILEKLMETVISLKAVPIVREKTEAVMAAFARTATLEILEAETERELSLMKKAQHFIGVRQPSVSAPFCNVPAEKMKLLLENFIKPVHYSYRNQNLNWVYLRSASQKMQLASKMNKRAFANYYAKAFTLNYQELDQLLNPLQQLLQQTKTVRIVGPGQTNLHFQLKNYGVYKSVGKHNLPDGEIFTAPQKESVEGWIEFNVNSIYYDVLFERVALKFEKGRVTQAMANNTQKLNEFLDIDEGARYVGEFALGVNPYIRMPIQDILFDEKMYGTLHLALGNAYPVADNGNRSAIHWDLILDQRAEQGGGKIYFDDTLIREDGFFVTQELQPLNFTVKI